MRLLFDQADPRRRAPTLAILLPGALQQPEEIAQAGFIDAVRARGLPLDLALVDLQLAHVGEATDGSVLPRLRAGVVQPARQRGYEDVWLAGISIGGFMALAYADRYPGGVDGLCLLAPYPGNRLLSNRITAAGGLRQWNAGAADEDGEHRVWQWLQSRRAADAPPIYFGYGLQDRFATGQQLMAAAFEPDCVDAVAGGHDWPVWLALWGNFLDRVGPRLMPRTMEATA